MSADKEPVIEVSVVIPAMDEEQTIEELYKKVSEVFEEQGKTFEIIFVDDGSGDGTYERMKKLCDADPRVRAVKFLKNFGKSAAYSAGFERARGHYIITMDADLQDDPSEIPRFIEALDRGSHLVTGWKKDRRDPLGKRMASRAFNAVAGALSGVRVHDMNCGFKALRREVTDSLRIYGELHRFIPALAAARGFKVTEIVVKHHPRKYGRSKYGLERALFLFDLLTVLFLTQYAKRPLRLFGGVGVGLGLLGAAALSYLTVLWFMGERPIGTRPMFLGGIMLLLLGAQLLSLGLVGELITHISSRAGDQYIVEEELNS
jgi:glycosyltransferase involved in cell wall biosynthesis